MATLVLGTAQAAQVFAPVTTSLIEKSEGIYSHEFTMTGQKTQPLRLNWMDRLSEIRATTLYESKLLAVGAIHGSAEGFSVVATNAGLRPADAFVLGREPMVSPSGRFVSFLQFVPRHAQAESLVDLVLIYDLQRLHNDVHGVANDEGWVSRAANQGVIVYPGSPRSERVFPIARKVGSAGPDEVKARSWARDVDLHLIVAVEGEDLVVAAVGAAPGGDYRVRQARVSAKQAFGSATPGSWGNARVLTVNAVGQNEVEVIFDEASGVPGGHLLVSVW